MANVLPLSYILTPQAVIIPAMAWVIQLQTMCQVDPKGSTRPKTHTHPPLRSVRPTCQNQRREVSLANVFIALTGLLRLTHCSYEYIEQAR